MTSREISPEVDRIVWSLGRAVPSRHRDRLDAAAADAGTTLHLIPPIADFLLADGIDRETAKLRFLYFPTSDVDARFDELLAAGLLTEDPRLRATERLAPLLTTLLDARAETAHAAWGGEDLDTVTTALTLARRAADAARPEHAVAVLHRDVPEPTVPEAALEHNLVTLRYVRQHDHAEAWRERGLTPAEMKVLSGLWAGEREAVDPSDRSVRSLIERGWVSDDGAGLTPLGTSEREAVERATNERNDVLYASLGSDARLFFDTLQEIPDADIVLS